MDKRIAHIGIIVEDSEAVEKLNSLLHEYVIYALVEWGYLS